LPIPRLIVLFDIDLTLIDYPLNQQTLAAALDEATGVRGMLDQINWHGATDRWLVGEGARLAGLPTEGIYERFADAYTRILGQSLATLPSSVLPGADALLTALARDHDAVLGIATGNMRRNAIFKLQHAGLATHFDPLRGGFGDHHADRADIVRAAAEDCDRRPGDRLVVLGDTERDVSAAIASDAVAIGVATGASSIEQLRAAGATGTLLSLSDLDSARTAILGA
jgi:phosphoglycolate phosphatase